MKNFSASQRLSLLSVIFLSILLTSYSPQQKKPANNNQQKNKSFQKTPIPDQLYQSGTIVFKVKQGIILDVPQESTVWFNIGSLDLLSDQYNATGLEKRFRHRPIPENSGLPDLSRIFRLTFSEDLDVEEVSRAFDADPNIEYAEPEPVCYVFETPNDAMYNQQQHLPQVMAEEAWEIHKGEDGDEEVVVAIIDTGIDWQHEDMSENCWQNMGEDADGDGVTLEWNGTEWILDPDDLNGIDDDNNGYEDDLIGWDFYDVILTGSGSNPDPYPPNPVFAHGTHVGSIAAGVTDNNTGVASISWNVKYMAVQVANNQNSVPWGFDGIIYAAESGADVINNSWGGFPYSQAHAEAIQYAHGLGSIVVCAAGNDYNNKIFYPASYPHAVSIASLSQNDIKTVYSCYGAAVDVSAPGGGWEGGILAAIPFNQYDHFSGTSMASPMVAGLMALVKSYHPDWSVDETIAQVVYTADNINDINPEYTNLLGQGRINAYNALASAAVTIPQELELELASHTISDLDGNDILEAGDTVVIDYHVRNFNPWVGDDDLLFTLTSDNPEISFLSDTYQADIEPDGSIIIEDVFKLVISENAEFDLSTITLNVESNLPLITGETFPLKVVVEPSGILVYDAKQIDRDMSGCFMQRFFKQLDLEVTHTCELPVLLTGFDAVFVSLENTGFNFDQCNVDGWHPDILLKYLLDGGNLYVESGGFFGGLDIIYPTYCAPLRSYFGIGSFTTQFVFNPINGLLGMQGSMMEGIAFSKSHQLYNFIFDVFTPSPLGICPFSESGLGNVSACRQGPDHNAFYLGYSLSELEDVDKTSSRYNVLLKILEFFELEISEDYLLANFKGDNRAGGAPLEVTFSDLSLTDENVQIVSWEWDFDGDGTMDSNEESPVFEYNFPGHYDVTLIVSTESDSDTLTLEDYVHVNQGILVYEMHEDEHNFSGTFIYDFLVEIGIDATYTSSYPQSFLGYEAVFISQSVFSYLNSTTPDRLTPMLIEYLSSGGQVYLEGADVLGRDLQLVSGCLNWFGLNSASDGFYNPLENLTGTTGSIAEGLVFELSNQTVYGNQDTYSPNIGAMVALKENNIYPVAVQHDGGTYKTFCFSYALAELQDNENGTREQLLTAILNFFGFVISGEDEKHVVESDLRIFPNPVSKRMHIYVNQDFTGTVECVLYSASGTTVSEVHCPAGKQDHFEMELDVSALTPGVYFLEIKTGQGNYIKKIIKH